MAKVWKFFWIVAAILSLLPDLDAEEKAGIPSISIKVQSPSGDGGLRDPGFPPVAMLGSKVVLAAEVQSPLPVAWQWFRNSTLVLGGTNSTLILDPVERVDEGLYSVAAITLLGRGLSAEVALYVPTVNLSRFLNLRIDPSSADAPSIEFTDSLESRAVWSRLGSTEGVNRDSVIMELSRLSHRFYRAQGSQTLTAQILPGWKLLGSTGTVHFVEFLDITSGLPRWSSRGHVTNTADRPVYVDTGSSNSMPRFYRTTMIAGSVGKRVGSVRSTVSWILTPEVYAGLVQDHRVALLGMGLKLDDTRHTLQLTNNAVPGYWVVVGDQRVMTDSQGDFEIEVPENVTEGFVVRSQGSRSTEADATFNVSQLRAPGEAPIPIVIPYERRAPFDMDGVGQHGPAGLPQLAEVICGDPARHIRNEQPCCLDYNGLIPTDCKDTTSDNIVAQSIHYFGSTCFYRVVVGLCAPEENSHAFWAHVPGLRCYGNHKYRNCQNVDLDPVTALKVTTAVNQIRCGNTVEIAIHNNSAANETQLTLSTLSGQGLGRLSGARISTNAANAYTLRHYQESTLESFHVEDDVIYYTAPDSTELPPGVDLIQVKITARAAGMVRVLQFTVSCSTCDSDPRLVPVANMVSIPAGRFVMGSPLDEKVRYADELQHEVILTRGFCMSKFEVTQEEYGEVMGSNPSFFHGDPRLPVESVKWSEAMEYCAKLTARERSSGRLPAGLAYRLPTEAEWEYACRAGTTTPFHYGSSLLSGMANFMGGFEYPFTRYNLEGEYLGKTAVVGSYAPNAFGLHDMHGNVREWCLDPYWIYPPGPVTDPVGQVPGENRATRGGGWDDSGWFVRSAFRNGRYSEDWWMNVGFRIVLASER